MDEKRVKVAESNFRGFLNDERIRKAGFQEIIYKTYLNNSLESLKVATELYKNKTSSLWVVVSSYYSMFYIASAYIYKKGYKAGPEFVHNIIQEALIVLARHDLEKHFLDEYQEEKSKALSASQNLFDMYEFEKAKRSEFQYETTGEIKESKASTSLERARIFVEIMRQLLRS